MKQGILATVLLAGLATVAGAVQEGGAAAAAAERWATPRRTVDNFLRFQNPPRRNIGIAAEAMAIDRSLSQEDRERLARQLKMVLDGRGLFVRIEAIPDDPDYVDPDTGLAEYVLFPERLPEVSVVKVGDRWLFSETTLAAIPRLYRETYSTLAESLIGLLPEAFHAEFLGFALWQYAGLFFLLLVGLALRKTADFLLDRLVHRLVRAWPWKLDDAFVRRAVKPLGFLVMIGFFSLTYADLHFSVRVNLVINVLLELAAAGCILWLAFRLVDLLSMYLERLTAKTETKLDDQLVPLLRKSLKIFVFVLAAITVVQNYGYSVSSIVAGLGIGGLAVALAARDTLANLFGSITIFADKPFQIGDWIKVAGVEGTVEEVGFRSTTIRTFYNSVVTLPNSKLVDTAIDNMGRRKYRRIKEVLGLTYSTSSEQMQAFVEGIRAIIAANPYMRKDFYEVHFNGYGDFSLDVLVYCFLEVPTWSDELREKHNFFLEILRLAEEIGVEFAFPTRTIHVDSFYKDEPRKVGKDLPPEEMARIVTEFGPGGRLARPHGPVLTLDGRPVSFAATSLHRRGSAEEG